MAAIFEWLTSILEAIANLGPWAAVAFIALYIGLTVGLVPGSIPTLAAGVLFGAGWGTLYVSIGATTGALLAFLIGRNFARSWVESKMSGSPKLQAVDRAISKEGGKIVFLLRLSPVFPFALLNYVLGITKVKTASYTFASWLGMLPGTLMYVYVGSLVGDLAKIASGDHQRTTQEWILFGGGLVATVIVTIYVTKIARRALDSEVETELTA